MSYPIFTLGELTRIRTGKLDANAANENGLYPFFTCAVQSLSINTAAFDCKAVLVAGNGDLNVKYYEGKFNAYQRTYVIESLDESKLLPKYLYLFLDKHVEKLREQSIGGVIKYIKLGNLTEAKIPLLPLAEQKRITEVLDKAAAIKAKREKAIAKLDELAQSTFVEMFGDFDKVINHTVKPLAQLIQDTKLGLVRGATELDEKKNYAYLRMNAITKSGEIQLQKMLRTDATDAEVKQYALRKGDFLFNTRNSRELVGKTALFDLEGLYLFNNNIMRIRFNNLMNSVYAAASFQTESLRLSRRVFCLS